MMAALEAAGADIVIGVRRNKQYTPWRKLVSTSYNLLVALLWGKWFGDIGSLKLARAEDLEADPVPRRLGVRQRRAAAAGVPGRRSRGHGAGQPLRPPHRQELLRKPAQGPGRLHRAGPVPRQHAGAARRSSWPSLVTSDSMVYSARRGRRSRPPGRQLAAQGLPGVYQGGGHVGHLRVGQRLEQDAAGRDHAQAGLLELAAQQFRGVHALVVESVVGLAEGVEGGEHAHVDAGATVQREPVRHHGGDHAAGAQPARAAPRAESTGSSRCSRTHAMVMASNDSPGSSSSK